MSTWTKRFVLDASTDHVYEHLSSYVAGKYEVVDERKPSYIKVKLRRTAHLSINILPRETGTYVKFEFDFSQELFMYIAYGILFIFIFTLTFSPPSSGLQLGITFLIIDLLYFFDSRGKKINSTIDDLISFLNSKGITIKKIEVEEAGERRPLDVDALYERLIEACSAIHCSERRHAKQYIEHKLKSYLKKGLNREEAIIKLAEKEGLLERAEREVILKWAEAKPKPKPQLPPETLYQRLLYKYSVYGRSISALEYRIEEYMWEGLSREEAITRLAEEEGVT